jgi:hypothetical protein
VIDIVKADATIVAAASNDVRNMLKRIHAASRLCCDGSQF